MPKRLVAVLVALSTFVGVGMLNAAPEPLIEDVTVQPGEGPWQVARRLCPHAVGTMNSSLYARNWGLEQFIRAGHQLMPGAILQYVPADCPAPPTSTTTSTTTTVAPATTVQPTTTTSTTSTTVPAPTTTSSVPAGGDWVQTFDGNQGGDTLRQGVYHRNVGSQELGGPVVTNPGIDNNAWHGGSWTADHDMACGDPSTQRPLESEKIPEADGTPSFDFHIDELQFACRDHWMTSIGDVDGYSIVWFSPDVEFTRENQRSVSWDVNVTDLGGRMWWEVSIVPTGAPFLATVDWMAAVAHIDTYDPASVVVGTGPAGGDLSIVTQGQQQYAGWRDLCFPGAEQDPVGCGSKTIRRSFSVTDNGDGTITVDYAGLFAVDVPGQLPEHFEVYFKQHAYTPDKDGPIQGHTWHWDNIVII